jgi:hypothetical protein
VRRSRYSPVAGKTHCQAHSRPAFGYFRNEKVHRHREGFPGLTHLRARPAARLPAVPASGRRRVNAEAGDRHAGPVRARTRKAAAAAVRARPHPGVGAPGAALLEAARDAARASLAG